MEDFYTRSFEKEYEVFINRMCELSWTLPEQGIGYPKVENIQELYIEIQSYDNVPENCLRVLFVQDTPVGFYGYLFEPGDKTAFLIGPVFLPEFHEKEMYQKLIELVEEESEFNFEKLIVSVNKRNDLFLKVIQDTWRKGYEEIEMDYDVQNFEIQTITHQVSRLDQSNPLFNDIAKLLGSIDGWDEPTENLKEYMEEDGMDVAGMMWKVLISGVLRTWLFIQKLEGKVWLRT